MQITPANYKAAGINPFDPDQNMALGQKIYEQFYGKYHDTAKALAAFDGDTHINADQQKYGDWIKGAKQETLDYLRKMEVWEGTRGGAGAINCGD